MADVDSQAIQARGDRDAAISRLDDGMAVAEKLRLPRLAAAINHERVRWCLPSNRRRPPGYGPCTAFRTTTMTSPPSPPSWTRPPESGCCREAMPATTANRPADMPGRCWPESTRPPGRWRPCRRLLLAETLVGAGRADDARDDIAAVRTPCTQYGLPQLLIDAGLG